MRLDFPQWSPPLRSATPPVCSLLTCAGHVVDGGKRAWGPGFAANRLCASDQGVFWVHGVFTEDREAGLFSTLESAALAQPGLCPPSLHTPSNRQGAGLSLPASDHPALTRPAHLARRSLSVPTLSASGRHPPRTPPLGALAVCILILLRFPKKLGASRCPLVTRQHLPASGAGSEWASGKTVQVALSLRLLSAAGCVFQFSRPVQGYRCIARGRRRNGPACSSPRETAVPPPL